MISYLTFHFSSTEKNPSTEAVIIDTYPLYQSLALDIIGKTGFGLDCNIQENPQDPLHAAVQAEFSKSPNSSCLTMIYLCCPEFAPALQKFRVAWLGLKQKMFNFSPTNSPLWDQAYRGLTDRLNTQTADENEPQPKDLLASLIKAHLSSDSIAANSVLFFEAAYETLSSSLAFCSHFLANHPETQKICRDELMNRWTQVREASKINDDEDLLWFETIKCMPQLDAVIKETLRIYPPQTTFIGR